MTTRTFAKLGSVQLKGKTVMTVVNVQFDADEIRRVHVWLQVGPKTIVEVRLRGFLDIIEISGGWGRCRNLTRLWSFYKNKLVFAIFGWLDEQIDRPWLDAEPELYGGA